MAREQTYVRVDLILKFLYLFNTPIHWYIIAMTRNNLPYFLILFPPLNSFLPWIVSAPLCTVTFGLMYCDLWISKPKKIVSAETIWRNTVGKTCSIKWSYIGKQMPPSPLVPKDFQTFLRPWVRRAGASFLQRGRKNSAPSIHSAEFFLKIWLV